MRWLPLALVMAAAPSPPSTSPCLEVVGRHASGVWNGSASEIAAWHAPSRRLLVVDAKRGLVALDLSDPAQPRQVALHARDGLNSVAVHGDLVAVVSQPADRRCKGALELLDPDGRTHARIEVGFGPDMVTFTPDGLRLLVANEGEGSPDGSFDPDGSIGVVDLSAGLNAPVYRELSFGAFEAARPELTRVGLHCVTPNATLAQDLEPEYVAVAPDGRRAFVTLQENNAVAVVDLTPGRERVERIEPLGFKDFSICGLDASDRDGGPRVAPAPVQGLLQPDSIKCFEHDGALWLVTADEGEERERADVQESARLGKLRHTLGSELGADARLGRLGVSSLRGDEDGDGVLDCIYCFGGRGFTLWKVGADGSIARVWDSGSEIERRTAEIAPACFNMDSEKGGGVDDRSDNRGPEPEGLEIAVVDGRRLVFVGLERTGGVMAWDISDPRAPRFLQWLNPRDAAVRAGSGAGDVAPEGLLVIPASESPTGEALLVVCNEVSGTTTVARIRAPAVAIEPPKPHTQP